MSVTVDGLRRIPDDEIGAIVDTLVAERMLNGAAGHTYGANGIWQCNRRGEPHGPSPHGGNYGNIPWDEAMQLPGSTQVGLGKALFAKFPWQKFEPHPEWATFARALPVSFEGAQWIWFPEATPQHVGAMGCAGQNYRGR